MGLPFVCSGAGLPQHVHYTKPERLRNKKYHYFLRNRGGAQKKAAGAEAPTAGQKG